MSAVRSVRPFPTSRRISHRGTLTTENEEIAEYLLLRLLLISRRVGISVVAKGRQNVRASRFSGEARPRAPEVCFEATLFVVVCVFRVASTETVFGD